jgi:vacuolar-type H+-ATPase subunit H
MPEDILAELRVKEQEMEALINGARREAASIREAALKSARELRAKSLAELDSGLKSVFDEKTEEMKAEAARIEDEGRKESESLRARGEGNLGKVVEEVMRFITEPGGAAR